MIHVPPDDPAEIAWMDVLNKRARAINPSATVGYYTTEDGAGRDGWYVLWTDIDDDKEQKRFLGSWSATAAYDFKVWLDWQKHERGLYGK